jgi:hypothetical protein
MQDDPFAEIPDWLRDLEPPSSDELELTAPESERPEEEGFEAVATDEEPGARGDSLVDDLREQTLMEDEMAEPRRPSGGLSRVFLGLSPTQRFILALLLFLDVALLGCMCLVMTGRVVPF